MRETERKQKEFIGYEYKELTAESSRISFLLDGYENFGWEKDGSLSEYEAHNSHSQQKKMVLRLKRNRKIVNKMELTRLQRNFEACIQEIEALERAKTSAATIYALILGIMGTAFMAGSVFAVTAEPPHILLCILFAAPGFGGWIFPYFVYKKVTQKQTQKLMPLIEEKYDEIYEICEKGNRLLY